MKYVTNNALGNKFHLLYYEENLLFLKTVELYMLPL